MLLICWRLLIVAVSKVQLVLISTLNNLKVELPNCRPCCRAYVYMPEFYPEKWIQTAIKAIKLKK